MFPAPVANVADDRPVKTCLPAEHRHRQTHFALIEDDIHIDNM